MIKILKKNSPLFLLLLIFFLAEVIVNPLGDYPLNDDWCYAKSVKILLEESRLDIGTSMATIFTHIMWGALFVKIFGFSHVILRISTLVSVFISLIVLYRLAMRISGNRKIAFIAGLTLLFNPIYFNLANTFMTDVNFNLLLLLSVYFAYDFFETGSKWSFALVFVFSAMLVLLRQFGLVVPFCFALACLILNRKRWLSFGIAIAGFVLVVFILKYYESYLKEHIPPDAVYKFTGEVKMGDATFWKNFSDHIDIRWANIVLHPLFYSLPLLLVFVPGLVKTFRWRALAVLISVLGYVLYFYQDVRYPMGNVFENTNLGAPTLTEVAMPEFWTTPQHYLEPGAESFYQFLKYLGMTLAVTVVILFTAEFLKNKVFIPQKKVFLFFLACLFVFYILSLLVAETFIDRYNIPLITIAIVLFLHAANRIDTRAWIAAPVLALFMYASVGGEKDYLTMNNAKWKGYRMLINKMNVPFNMINGGYEMYGWFEGRPTNIYIYYDFKKFDYLIGHKPNDHFTRLLPMVYQRYFPYKKDTLNIFVRTKNLEGQQLPELLKKRAVSER